MQRNKPETIKEAVLDPEEYLVLHIGGNMEDVAYGDTTTRVKQSVLRFFQVADVAELSYEPIVPRDSDGTEKPIIDTGDGVDYDQLYDSDGDHVLRNTDSPWRVYHFSLGMRQDDVNIYPRIPDNQNGGGWDWLSGSEPSPADGQNFGFVSSDETDYNDPSVELETLAWEGGTNTDHQYGFYNAHSQHPVKPLMSLEGRAYELRPVTERDSMLELMADAARPPSKRSQTMRVVPFSRGGLRTFSYDVPDEWDNVDNSMQVSQANLPTEIERTLEQERSDKQ